MARANNGGWDFVKEHQMTLQEYYDELDKHDWFYYMSDDMSVYKKGQDRGIELAEMGRNLGKEYWELYGRFNLWCIGQVNGNNISKPERPE